MIEKGNWDSVKLNEALTDNSIDELRKRVRVLEEELENYKQLAYYLAQFAVGIGANRRDAFDKIKQWLNEE